MGSVVSSMVHYSEVKPEVSFSEDQVQHEMEHLKIRERVSGAISIAGSVLAGIILVGLLGGGQILFGALAAIALVSGVYAYFCRDAESSLKAKQMIWRQDGVEGMPTPTKIQVGSKAV